MKFRLLTPGPTPVPEETLLELAKLPQCWIKVCGSERIDFPPYDKAVPIARKIVETIPDRVLWGTDFPHPNPSHEANEGELVDLLPQFERRLRLRILTVRNDDDRDPAGSRTTVGCGGREHAHRRDRG